MMAEILQHNFFRVRATRPRGRGGRPVPGTEKEGKKGEEKEEGVRELQEVVVQLGGCT